MEVTSAPWSWATYATAMVSLWTSMPIKSVLDWDMVDLRVESCCCGSMRLWFRVSSPAFHRGSTYRHWKSLCLGSHRREKRRMKHACIITSAHRGNGYGL